jgi:exodeoxyribonuclease III
MRLVSVNVNGLRAAVRKGFLDWLPAHQPDVVCLQETRIQDHQLTDAMRAPGGMKAWYHPAEKAGYSGVALYSRQQPDRIQMGMGIEKYDQEGRVIAADFGSLRVISLYLPSGSAKEERQQFKYGFMDDLVPWIDQQRAEMEHVVVCGDWNIAHRKIDLKNWRGNQKNSGFLPEERAWMDRLLGQEGWVDTYRQLHPDLEGEAYTWWSNRGQAWANNTGWRIDYQIASPKFAALARNAAVYKDERFSDHSPLTTDFDFSPAK